MSGDNRPAVKQVKRIERAARIYGRRVAQLGHARTELNKVRDRVEFERLNAALDIEAGNLRSIRATLIESSRAIGVGVDLPEVVG